MQTDETTERAGRTGPGTGFGFDRIFGLTFQAFNDGWRGFAVLIVLALALSILLELAFGAIGIGEEMAAEVATGDQVAAPGGQAEAGTDLRPGQILAGLMAVLVFFVVNLVLHFAAVSHAWTRIGPAPGRLRDDFGRVRRRFTH